MGRVRPSHPRELSTLASHTGPVSGIAFSADGHVITTAGTDNLVLWDVSRPTTPTSLVMVPTAGQMGTSIVYLSTSAVLFATPGNSNIRLSSLDFNIEKATRRICAAVTRPISPAEWTQYFPDYSYDPPCS